MSKHKDKAQRKAERQLFDVWTVEAGQHFAGLGIPQEEATSDALLDFIIQTHGEKLVMETIQQARGASVKEVLDHSTAVFVTALLLERGVALDVRKAKDAEIMEDAKYQMQHDPDFAREVREVVHGEPPDTEPPKEPKP